MTNTFKYASIGSISHATLRTQDLLETFSDELKKHVRINLADMTFDAVELCFRILHDAVRVSGLPDDNSNEAQEVVNRLSDALDLFAPPYTYFGAHQGNSSDFGFWPNETLFDDMNDHGLMKYNDLSESPVGLFGLLTDAFQRREWLDMAEIARKLDRIDSDLSKHAELFSSDFIVVNDHGNLSVHRADGTTIWSVV